MKNVNTSQTPCSESQYTQASTIKGKVSTSTNSSSQSVRAISVSKVAGTIEIRVTPKNVKLVDLNTF